MRVLGIDYGRRRIGLALSDATGLLARPWKTVARVGNPSQVAAALAQEIAALPEDEGGVAGMVVGLPRRLNGEDSELSADVRELAGHLARLTSLPVHCQDERLSSVEADARLARDEKDWRKRKERLDAAAAAVILQDYLDGRERRTPIADADGAPGDQHREEQAVREDKR